MTRTTTVTCDRCKKSEPIHDIRGSADYDIRLTTLIATAREGVGVFQHTLDLCSGCRERLKFTVADFFRRVPE